MIGVAAKKVLERGRHATREVLIACNGVRAQSAKPCVRILNQRVQSRL